MAVTLATELCLQSLLRAFQIKAILSRAVFVFADVPFESLVNMKRDRTHINRRLVGEKVKGWLHQWTARATWTGACGVAGLSAGQGWGWNKMVGEEAHRTSSFVTLGWVGQSGL